MFVDASAILAILNREAEAAMIADALERSHSRVTSPIAIYPARLDMGDCFAYAAARTRGVPLLYKGKRLRQDRYRACRPLN